MKTPDQNPLLKSSTLFDEAVPFDQIEVHHFLPAIDFALEEAKTNIEKIKSNPASPSFENTILALEQASESLDHVAGIYFNLYGANADEALQSLAKDISPKIASFGSDVTLDLELFAKVEHVYQNRERMNLNAEQLQLLDKSYKSFTRNGAKLDPETKDKVRAIDQEQSVLNPQFSENVLKATNAFELFLEKKDLKGTSEAYQEAAYEAAKEKGQEGKYLITLQYPSYIPFMQFADNRELREKVWRASGQRNFNDAYDNQEIVKKIVSLRHQRAKLLGYDTHAAFVLEERMAETPGKVQNFLGELLVPSKQAASKDLAELKAFRSKTEGSDEIRPWDQAYYSEKLKTEKFDFNEEELRPYFALDKVVDGVFEHAKKLYGLQFQERKDIPAYHKDVRVFEVKKSESGDYVGLFYCDFFPRATKRGGAWMTEFRGQGLYGDTIKRPHVAIVCNFTKPTATTPSLLTLNEVRTLFHEFGHSLHGLLSDVTYKSLGGPNVYWDFVELPSQIMENWANEKEGLDLFAKHYKTGESIPDSFIEKIKKASQFQTGLFSLRQLSLGLLDMAWHGEVPGDEINVGDYEKEATKETSLLKPEPDVCMSTSFSHIFAGGYSAGYYSYKWAEVLDADAFEYFKEQGIFNAEVATKFRDNILSKGGTEHPMTLYKNFRGREPDPKALLRRDGMA